MGSFELPLSRTPYLKGRIGEKIINYFFPSLNFQFKNNKGVGVQKKYKIIFFSMKIQLLLSLTRIKNSVFWTDRAYMNTVLLNVAMGLQLLITLTKIQKIPKKE